MQSLCSSVTASGTIYYAREKHLMPRLACDAVREVHQSSTFCKGCYVPPKAASYCNSSQKQGSVRKPALHSSISKRSCIVLTQPATSGEASVSIKIRLENKLFPLWYMHYCGARLQGKSKQIVATTSCNALPLLVSSPLQPSPSRPLLPPPHVSVASPL